MISKVCVKEQHGKQPAKDNYHRHLKRLSRNSKYITGGLKIKKLSFILIIPALLLTIPATVHAGEPFMLKDIHPSGDSYPDQLTIVNGTLFFRANDGTNGTELWKSNGTEAGTIIVKDINPGSGASVPEHLTDVNGTLFFQAGDSTNGFELWKSDGSEAGTIMIKDINPGGDTQLLHI